MGTPVENMSLALLILIAALHSNVVSNATRYSTKPTFVLYIISFILVLYSTPYPIRSAWRYLGTCIYGDGARMAANDIHDIFYSVGRLAFL